MPRELVLIVGGGLVVILTAAVVSRRTGGDGLAAGWATVLLRQRWDDPVLNTTILFAVPFLAYFPAEELGASRVLSVVVAARSDG